MDSQTVLIGQLRLHRVQKFPRSVPMENDTVAEFVCEVRHHAGFDKPSDKCGLHTAEEVFPDLSLAPPHFPAKFWIWMSPSGWEVSQEQCYPPDQTLFEAVGRSDLAGTRSEMRKPNVNSNSQQLDGTSVMHVAIRAIGRTPKAGIGVLRALLANGTSANVFDSTEQTPLMIACRDGCSNAVEMLLANGADANMQGDDGNAAMHLAVAQGTSTSMLQLMIAGGADGSLMNQSGCTAINIARDAGYSHLVAVLNPCSPMLSLQASDPTDPNEFALVEASAQFEPEYNAQGEVRCPFAGVRGEVLARAISGRIKDHKILEIPNLELVMTREFDRAASGLKTKSRTGSRPRADPTRLTVNGNKKLDRRFDLHTLPTEPFMAFLRCPIRMPALWYTNGALIARTKNEIEPESDFCLPEPVADGEFLQPDSIFSHFDSPTKAAKPTADGEETSPVLSPSKAAQRGRKFLVQRAIREFREGIPINVFLQELNELAAADLFTSESHWEETDPARPRSVVRHRATCRLQLYAGDLFALSVTHKRCGGDRIRVVVEGMIVVGKLVRKPDGVWYFTTDSKAQLDADDQPITAVQYETKFTAVAETVAEMRNGDCRVTSMKIQGDMPCVTVDEVVGPSLFIVKLASEGARPIDLKTLTDADNDGVPDELHGWVTKIWGPNPPIGHHCLYLCPSSGEVFATVPDCEKYTVLKGFTDFSKIDFWVFIKATIKGAEIWDVTCNATNPAWKNMYIAIYRFDTETLDEMWAEDRTLLSALDLHGASVLHYLIKAAAKEGTTEDQMASAAEILRLVLVQGGNSNVVGPNGQTPLHLAADAGMIDVVELLLINGGVKKAQTEDKDGKTPIDLARAREYDDVTELLHGFLWSPKKACGRMFG